LRVFSINAIARITKETQSEFPNMKQIHITPAPTSKKA
jgi:hypothetical protein